jgi:ribosomal-protein-alanine N-acetyltransferase
MLRHAFENLGAIRVHFQADNRNTHSLNAIARLGAKNEGVLRKHVILPDGYARDSAMFSIIDDEWPGIKTRLEERLGYVPWNSH